MCLFFSCKQKISPESPSELYEKYRRSVVLIRNHYYYEIDLGNGSSAYFTELKNGEVSDLTFDEKVAIKNANTSYGSGFFISTDGKIATNRHVVDPEINDATIIASLKLKFDNVKFDITEYQNDLTKRILNIENYISLNYDRLTLTALQELNDKKTELNDERLKMSMLNIAFDFTPSKSKIKCNSILIGVAFDNTFVTNQSDFKECVTIKKSSDPLIDIAIIQLKDKKTPESVKTIIDFEDHNPNIKNGTFIKGEEYNIAQPVKINTRVYMIGYNYGFELANTGDGLKAQLTQGEISQESDEKRVLYSIPSLNGSSGSPILDQWGNLIAINYAKVSNTQSFNYGIRAKYLKEILDGGK